MTSQVSMIITIVSIMIFAISCLNGVIIMPLIFNFFIIPKIEKKTGKKLEYAPYWNVFLFGNFIMGYAEIMQYILVKYLALKFKKSQDAIRVNGKFALEKIKYDIKTASNFEIKMSFLAAINALIGAISLIIGNLFIYISSHH